MLKSLFQFLNRDLTGRSWEREIAHDYFTNLVYFGNKDRKRAYWEAEVPAATGPTFVAYLQSGPEGPSPADEQFCRELATKAPDLCERCASLVSRAAGRSVTGSLLRLESIEVPENGDITKPWEATFDLNDQLFVVRMQHGEPTAVVREGDAG